MLFGAHKYLRIGTVNKRDVKRMFYRNSRKVK